MSSADIMDDGDILPPSDLINWGTFSEIIAMDDDDEMFSTELFLGFFKQAEQTFKEMREALANKDLAKLSYLGHYIKGSASSLGLQKVQLGCAKIQNYGVKKDLEPTANLSVNISNELLPTIPTTDEEWLKLIERTLDSVEETYRLSKDYVCEYLDIEIPEE